MKQGLKFGGHGSSPFWIFRGSNEKSRFLKYGEGDRSGEMKRKFGRQIGNGLIGMVKRLMNLMFRPSHHGIG